MHPSLPRPGVKDNHYASSLFGLLKTLIQIVSILGDVRFGSLADIEVRQRGVRFTPKSGHRSAVLTTRAP